jgi:hypothetical protein
MDSTFTSLSVCEFDDPLRVVIELLSNKKTKQNDANKAKTQQQPATIT